MTLPASLRINAQFPFPSLVIANGPVTVSKQNGIWTVGFNIANLAGIPSNVSPGALEVLLYNTLSQTFQQATAAQLLSLASSASRTVTVTGAQAAALTDQVLLVNAAGAVNISLPASVTRFGLGPYTIKDISGAAATNNITITAAGGDTIDGQATYTINDDYECLTVYPLVNGGYWIG